MPIATNTSSNNFFTRVSSVPSTADPRAGLVQQTPNRNQIGQSNGNHHHHSNTSSMSKPAFLASRAVGPPGKRYRGAVVYYTNSKGFGFAHTEKPEVWKIYMHIYALEKAGVTDLDVGMELEFNVRENHKGKYACNVSPVVRDNGGATIEPIPMMEGRHRGTLKSFDSQRLFGWVMCGDTEVFMTIYELKNDNAEQHLVPGTVLEFTIGKHARGPTAYDIDIVSSAAVNPQMGQTVNAPSLTRVPSATNNNATMMPNAAFSGLGGLQIPTTANQVQCPSVQDQINAILAAAMLNTQAWTQLMPQNNNNFNAFNNMPTQNNGGANPSPLLTAADLPTVMMSTLQQLGMGMGGTQTPNAMPTATATTTVPNLHSLGLSLPTTTPTNGMTTMDSMTGAGQGAETDAPLLRLPSMSTHSPLLKSGSMMGNTDTNNNGLITTGLSGWDDVLKRDGSLGLGLETTAAWSSALLF